MVLKLGWQTELDLQSYEDFQDKSKIKQVTVGQGRKEGWYWKKREEQVESLLFTTGLLLRFTLAAKYYPEFIKGAKVIAETWPKTHICSLFK